MSNYNLGSLFKEIYSESISELLRYGSVRYDIKDNQTDISYRKMAGNPFLAAMPKHPERPRQIDTDKKIIVWEE